MKEVSAWLESLGLELDCGLPGNVGELLDVCWSMGGVTTSEPSSSPSQAEDAEHQTRVKVQAEAADARWVSVSERDSIVVRKTHLGSLPVFTAEWAQCVQGVDMARFWDWMLAPPESCMEWDSTCLGAEEVSRLNLSSSSEGTGDVVRLLRYRFSAGPLFARRDMLYLAVSCHRGAAAMVAYLSVRSAVPGAEGERWDPPPGFVQSRNLVPSFDLAEPTTDGPSGIRVRHVMTTHFGGAVPECAWNRLFAGAVTGQYLHEGLRVRELLLGRGGAASAASATEAHQTNKAVDTPTA